jgi:hypothetical protein
MWDGGTKSNVYDYIYTHVGGKGRDISFLYLDLYGETILPSEGT